MKISIDKDKAGAYGITMQDIGITMGTMMADGYVNRIDLDGPSYEVIPQVGASSRPSRATTCVPPTRSPHQDWGRESPVPPHFTN